MTASTLCSDCFLPKLLTNPFVLSSSAYDTVMYWLSPLASRSPTDAMTMLAMDLQSHRNINQGP